MCMGTAFRATPGNQLNEIFNLDRNPPLVRSVVGELGRFLSMNSKCKLISVFINVHKEHICPWKVGINLCGSSRCVNI
jgi:hypothetical protein